MISPLGLTADDLSNLAEMQRLLEEAYIHYFAFSDGHCKSAEGVVGLESPTYWNYGERWGCSVYSYVLGPSRQHHFSSTDAALAAVKVWHELEMERDYRD